MMQVSARRPAFGRRRLLGFSLAAGTATAASLLPGLERVLPSRLPWGSQPSPSALLTAAIASYLAASQTLVLDGRRWAVARQALGLTLTPVIQPGPIAFWPGLMQPLPTIAAEVDHDRLISTLADLADLERPAVDADLRWADGQVNLTAERPGRRVNLDELSTVLRQWGSALNEEPIGLPMQTIKPAVTAADLNPMASLLQRALARPLTIASQQERLTLSPQHIAGALKVTSPAVVEPDDLAWEALLKPLADRLAAAPVEPTLIFENGSVRVAPPVQGRVLAVEPTTDAIWDALRQGRTELTPVVEAVAPRWTAADLAPALALANRLLQRPPVLTANDSELALTPADLVRLLRSEGTTLTIDAQAAMAVLQEADKRLAIAPRPPFFRWRDGQAVLEENGRPGRRLDLAAARAVLSEGLLRGEAKLSLPTTEATFSAPAPVSLDFAHVLAEGRTYFGDSSADRYRNVALGLARINGALVPPGGLFSFNQASGPVTLATGFRKGYGIAISNGAVTTVPSVGGGICQVATTVFHAAFRSGMPIVDRSWHLYWMPRYGRPPSGVTGLDATVDDQYGLDFTFTNATEGWLLIEASVAGGNAVVRLRGVDPGWKVTVEGPFISNIVPANTAMVERRDPSLPAGARVWVEHAEDGKTVTIRRTVVDTNGQQRERRDFRSIYAPAANVTLVGTGGR